MAFIDDHRDRVGIEPICRVLAEHGVKIAPSGDYAFKQRPPSARALRDAELAVQMSGCSGTAGRHSAAPMLVGAPASM